MPELQEKPQQIFTSHAGWMQAFARIDSSFRERRTGWMCLLLLAGFLLRVWHASGTFLNSDEVMHFAAANQTSWLQTYEAGLSLSHPPLLIFVLHLWRALGTSELTLRMPSILAGMAFCWFTFLWAPLLFEESTSWIILIFSLFLPTSIELSTEIRQYALLLAFAMASAYCLERALAKNCAASMLLSGMFLWLAIGSHFSAFLFGAALGIYALWRMLAQLPAKRVMLAWIAGQLIAAGLCVFLYVTQIRGLSHYFGGQDPTRGWMGNAYLSHSYFLPGRVNPLLFIIGRTIGVFQYTFRQLLVGDVAFIFFLAGIILVFRGRASTNTRARQIGFLLLLPFILNCAAALFRAYPYGGTRHSSFLIPFALAGVSVALAKAFKERIAFALAAAVLISLACRLTVAQKPPFFSSSDERSSNMQAAINFVHQLPAAEPIFVDFQTSLMLGHYLCDQRAYSPDHSHPGFISYECGAHRVISSNTKYVFTASSFYDQLRQMTNEYHLQPGSNISVAQMGWNANLAAEIANSAINPRSFGSEIHLFQYNIGEKPGSATPPSP